MEFVDVYLVLNPTWSPTEHKVSLAYSERTKVVTVLGQIPHGAEIVVNQKLIDDLQNILNKSQGEK